MRRYSVSAWDNSVWMREPSRRFWTYKRAFEFAKEYRKIFTSPTTEISIYDWWKHRRIDYWQGTLYIHRRTFMNVYRNGGHDNDTNT